MWLIEKKNFFFPLSLTREKRKFLNSLMKKTILNLENGALKNKTH